MTLPENATQILTIVLIIMNGCTFALFGYDKWMAQTRGWRVPEAVLWICSFLGGSIGGLAGMHLFRHKTKKLSFQLMMAVILVIQAVVIWYLFFYTTGASNSPYSIQN